MNNSIYIGKILGIEIKIHYSWFIIFLLVVSTLSEFFSQTQGWSISVSIIIGAISALLIFASILSHEIAHSFIGIRNKVPIKSISLFVFGGVAQIGKEPSSPFVEFKMAISGPLFSLALAAVFWFLTKLPLGAYLPPLFAYLAITNFILVLFNLIPAFPLDGGRVFRSILWSGFKDLKRATFWASKISSGFAFLIIILGFLEILSKNYIGGIWLIFIGWFLIQAAEMSFRQVLVKQSLSKIKISEIMNREFKTLSPNKRLQDAKRDFFNFQQGGFPVVEKDKLVGIITVEDIRKVLEENLAIKKVKDVMTPISKLVTISPAGTAFDAVDKMTKYNIGRLPVVADGKLLGLVTRASLLFVLSLIEEGDHNIG